MSEKETTKSAKKAAPTAKKPKPAPTLAEINAAVRKGQLARAKAAE